MTQQDDFEELLGAYALDACDPAEAEAIAQHLAKCPRCRAELAAHLEVAGVLGNLGGVAPEGLWDRIWGEIGSPEEGDAPPAHGGGTGSSRAPGTPNPPPPPFGVIEGAPSSTGSDGTSPRAGSNSAGRSDDEASRPASSSSAEERARRRWSFAVVSGAAAAVLAIAVGVLGTTVANLNHQVSALNQAVIAGGVRGAEQAALAEPGHRAIQLASTTSAWRAKLVVLPTGQAFLVPEKMPSISASRTFQAWAVVKGKPVSLGVLGRSTQIRQLLLQPDMTAVMVNTEPLGGTGQPTTPAVVQGSLGTPL